MAADALISTENINVGHIRKIIKTEDGCLAGAAGDCDYLQQFLDWANTNRTTKAPKYVKDTEGLLVLPNGEIRYYQGPTFSILTNGYAALGQGCPAALAVMKCGFGAEKAVEIAMEIHPNCGGPIYIERLDDEKTEPTG